MDDSISPYLNKSSTRSISNSTYTSMFYIFFSGQRQQAILKKTASFIGSGPPPHSSTGQSAEKRRRINDSQLILSVKK